MTLLYLKLHRLKVSGFFQKKVDAAERLDRYSGAICCGNHDTADIWRKMQKEEDPD